MNTRIIPDTPQLTYQTAVLRNRPTRLGYIVNRNIQQDLLHDVLRYNTSIWGGKYNLFVPTDGQEIREDWWQVLLEHDPDIVLYVGDVDHELMLGIYNAIQPYNQMKWFNRLTETFDSEFDRFGLTVYHLLRHHEETEGVIEPSVSNCVYPVVENSDYQDYFHIAFGNYATERHSSGFKKLLSAREITCNPKNITEYCQLWTDVQNRMTPLKFSAQHLNLLYNNQPDWYGATIVIDNGNIDNLFLFHTLQWSMMSKQNIIIPICFLNNEDDFSVLGKWIIENVTGASFIHLINSDNNLESLQEIREHLRPHLKPRIECIDLVTCNFQPAIPNLYSDETQQQIRRYDRKLNFDAPSLSFAQTNSAKWIIDIDLSPGLLNREGFLPTKFPGVNSLLSGYTLPQIEKEKIQIIWARASRGNLTITSSKYIVRTLRLPTPSDLFTLLFQQQGWQVRQDEKGRYYQGMLQLAGGLSSLSILREEISSKLLGHSDFQKGTAFTTNQMKKNFKLGKKKEELKQLISDLALKSILLRGYTLRCTNCDLEQWYAIQDAREKMTCKGCLSQFQMDPDIRLSYRLNELFIRGIEQGGRTVLLTILLLKNTVRNSLIWDVGYKLTDKNGEVDIDFVAMADSHLIMGECKDSIGDPEKLKPQLKKDVYTAKKANADMFILSTLNEEMPQEIQELIQELEKETDLPIYTFTRDNLMNNGLYDEQGQLMQIENMTLTQSFVNDKCVDKDKRDGLLSRSMTF